MEPSPLRTFVLFISIFLVTMPFATANTGGYTATPAVAGALMSPPQDPVPISFWDLTLREMMIALALSFCPVLVYPVEIFFSLKIMSALGDRKVDQYAVSYNKNRQKIYDVIKANPGVKFNELERLTEIKEGTLKYHMLVLSMKRRIIAFGSGRSVRYFENNGRYSELEKKVFLHLQNPTTRKILKVLASSPEVSRKDIAETVGISGPSVSWHTKRLSGDGIITTEKSWRAARYTLCPAGAEIFKKFFAENNACSWSATTGQGLDKADTTE